MAGETASFSDEDADVRIQAGVAELVKHYTVQPDQRVDSQVDEHGHTVIKTKIVPDDLARNVDLPPTEAGGKPKAEENMSEDEKARVQKYEETGNAAEANRAARGKALDGAPVNKMAEGPAKKKQQS